ncbi:MAG: hypothetical protein KAH20_02740 [Methylococcales bacterium]|nr:hypothetical protein [Methylococcales bacterium]
MKIFRLFFTVLGLIFILFFAPLKTSHANENSGTDYGYIAGSGFTSLIYTPLKGAYALLMGVTGGLSLMATMPANKSDISLDLVNLGIGGDWWVSPDHLRGNRPLHFNGPSRQSH